MQKYNIIIIFILFLPFSIFAKNTNEVSQQLNDIGIYLNHQDFQNAKKIQDNILYNISLDTLAKELSYDQFITLIQIISWSQKGTEFSELLRLRYIYFPDDFKRAALLTRQNRDEYWKNCTSDVSISFIDRIDSAMCIAYTESIPLFLKKILLKRFIAQSFAQVLNEGNIQNMSDFSNFLSRYISMDPSQKNLYSFYQRQLGLRIIKKDPSWVNGYFILISNSKIPKERDKWIDQLTKNYLGDMERWEKIVIPYIDSYK